MINCAFEINSKGLYECSVSGWVFPGKITNSLHGKCPLCKEKSRTPEVIAAQAAQQAEAAHRAKHGCGAHLHKAIKALTGEGITTGCGCSSKITELNTKGPAWARANVETIIDWLLEEVDRRLEAAQDAQKPARWRLRLSGLDLPGRRWALRRLVLGAVRRAERSLTTAATDPQPSHQQPSPTSS